MSQIPAKPIAVLSGHTCPHATAGRPNAGVIYTHAPEIAANLLVLPSPAMNGQTRDVT